MSSKEVKARLKAAKAAVDKKDFQEVQKCCQGWGMVRVENPKLGPGHPMEQLAPWETFQVLGPHHGADISDNTTIKSLCAGVKNYCLHGVNLVIADVPAIPFGAHPPGYSEYVAKTYLLSQFICACKILGEGGVYICRVYELLTRFSAGILYLMYKIFDEVTVLKPITSSSTSSERFIVCKGFRGCKPILTEMLLEVNGHIHQLREDARVQQLREDEQTDVLEILPVQLLFEEQFHRYLTQSNERIAKHRTKIISRLDKYFTMDPEALPGTDAQALLRKGLIEILQLTEMPH